MKRNLIGRLIHKRLHLNLSLGQAFLHIHFFDRIYIVIQRLLIKKFTDLGLDLGKKDLLIEITDLRESDLLDDRLFNDLDNDLKPVILWLTIDRYIREITSIIKTL